LIKYRSIEIDLEIIKTEVDHSLAYVIVLETVLQSSQGRNLKAQSIATNLFQKMRTRILRLPQNREMSVAEKWYLVQHHGSPIMR
jgi:pyruvate/2-oxoglutarate/acetoin dehydrogenase E1 component